MQNKNQTRPAFTQVTLSWISCLLVLVLAGCSDTSTGPGAMATMTTFEGQVTTTSEATSKRAEENVEDATVRSASLDDDGRPQTSDSETQTDEEGRFQLDASSSTSVTLLTATKGSFQTSVLAYADGASTVRTAPMTAETNAEAEVYIEAKRQDDEDEHAVTLSDVAFHVTSDLATQLEANATSSADVAAGLVAQAEAEGRLLESEEVEEEQQEQAMNGETQAYAQLQAQLASATNASAKADARLDFDQQVAATFQNAAISPSAEARARLAGKAALMQRLDNEDTEVRASLEARVRTLSAMAKARAIEASFEASSATETQIAAVVEARTQLMASLQQAGSLEAVITAEQDFESSVREEATATLSLNTATRIALETALSTVTTTLNASLSNAGSAEAVASAQVTFFEDAEAVIESSLQSRSEADVALATEVFVLFAAD